MPKYYWFSFEKFDYPTPLNLGVGVTAFSKEEAIDFLKRKIFTNIALPPIAKCIENIDISTLELNHIRPNMGNPARRGIWFPLGYDN